MRVKRMHIIYRTGTLNLLSLHRADENSHW